MSLLRENYDLKASGKSCCGSMEDAETTTVFHPLENKLMKTKYFGRLIGLVSVVLLLAGGMLAQETTGGLTGQVKDPTGAVVSGAKVTLTAPTLVGTKSFTTDSSGNYRFANLPPGSYTLTVTATGFSTDKRTRTWKSATCRPLMSRWKSAKQHR